MPYLPQPHANPRAPRFRLADIAPAGRQFRASSHIRRTAGRFLRWELPVLVSQGNTCSGHPRNALFWQYHLHPAPSRAEMMPLRANTRRWPRHQVDLPVSIVLNGTPRMVVPGRATEISEGGMALYAGMIHPKPGDLMEIEFQAPSCARVTGIIRNRACFCFGLEFLTPLSTDKETTSGAQLAAFALEQGRRAEAEQVTPATA